MTDDEFEAELKRTGRGGAHVRVEVLRGGGDGGVAMMHLDEDVARVGIVVQGLTTQSELDEERGIELKQQHVSVQVT